MIHQLGINARRYSKEWYNEPKDMSRTNRRFLAPQPEPAGHQRHPGCSSQALLALSFRTGKPQINLQTERESNQRNVNDLAVSPSNQKKISVPGTV
jgi:hypothetical protein